MVQTARKRDGQHSPCRALPGAKPKVLTSQELATEGSARKDPRNLRRRGKKARALLHAPSLPRQPSARLAVTQSWMDNQPTLSQTWTEEESSVRNMRSKCRCSYVLQFTFRHAVSCVLHRLPSQVIHCTVLFISTNEVANTKMRHTKLTCTKLFFGHPTTG